VTNILAGKRVLLGVSGGIAAYKVIELARMLVQHQARVDVVMTRAALEFVTPLTFQTLTRRPVRVDAVEQWTEHESGHVTLAAEADVMIVAPATANVIAKLAHGVADDMLTVSALACPAPLIVAPAMDHHMFLHPATQANITTLRSRSAVIVGPDDGPLASGIIGHGRLVSNDVILGTARHILGRDGPLTGRRLVVSSGPTWESIDPIRYISNRSSGKMGYAIAQAAIDAGARVTLVAGPTVLQPPIGVDLIRVESARQMFDAVDTAVTGVDVLIMAAAVADYTPAEVASEKIKKSNDDVALTLTRTIDILKTIHRDGLVKVGFAAETTNLMAYAEEKLRSKGVHLLVANDAVTTMGQDRSSAWLLRPDEPPLETPLQSKDDLAQTIVALLPDLIESTTRQHAPTD
jgi:phosphopantothenoylcysteine decarboxylase / phosphopantothenate---cysteine ligase